MKKDHTPDAPIPVKSPIFVYVFLLPFLLIGLFTVSIATHDLIMAKASLDWPKVKGEILKSSIRESSGDSGSSTKYRANVNYKFMVGDKPFDGDRVSFNRMTWSGSKGRKDARLINSRFREGNQVNVFYLPGNPNENVLEPGVKLGTSFFLIFGLMFLLPAIGMYIYVTMRYRKYRVSPSAS